VTVRSRGPGLRLDEDPMSCREFQLRTRDEGPLNVCKEHSTSKRIAAKRVSCLKNDGFASFEVLFTLSFVTLVTFQRNWGKNRAKDKTTANQDSPAQIGKISGPGTEKSMFGGGLSRSLSAGKR
jgi:hypothetical protein